ncbi:MAG: phosphate acyltransferase PlsX [Tissierellia bacterium]|nr:phosphate acyltransferase PlsX [Tissierellia bacterium]MDD4726933.1 phosphate acyltransferase PlsX [Tissierellia bacterium]
MKIIVDGMGGDNAPTEIVKGTVDAVNEYGIDAIIVGKEQLIKDELNKYNFIYEKIEILNAENVISNDDDPAMAIRRNKNSSLVVGLNALKDGLGDGFISAGSTGALLAGGLFIIKRIQGIDRAAITSVYPTSNGISLLVDAGANADCKPQYLKQFALMGSIYTENVLGKKNPKVGLVNIGTEEGKGNQLVKGAYELLKNEDLNFIGNVEGRNLPTGEVDVIVCDGFVGNVVLKLTEGMAITIFSILKKSLMSSTKTKIGASLIKSELSEIKKLMDYREYGGAPLLGTRLPIVKAHGSSDAYAIKNAIRQLISFIDKDIIKLIENNMEQNINKMEE